MKIVDWIVSVIGADNAYETFSLIWTFLTYLTATMFYMFRRKRRKLFALRLVLTIFVGILISFGFALLNKMALDTIWTIPTRIFCYFNLSAMVFGVLVLCYEEPIYDLLLLWCSGICTQHIANKTYPLIQNFIGINDSETISLFHPNQADLQDWEFILQFAIILGIIASISFLFRKTYTLSDETKTHKKVATITSIFTIIINTLICISRLFEKESMALSMLLKTFTISFCVLIMFILSGVFESSKKDQEYLIIKELLHREKAQFENVKTNMEAINTKVHDLKKILDKVEDKMNEEELEDLKKALEFYDSTMKTGDNILDVVLSEKSLICKQNNIKFTCMADGKNISILTPTQIYSLFGNIMDNAIRATKELDEDKRFISLTIKEEKKKIIIEEMNFYKGKLNIINDSTIETTKLEKSKHGFGIKSISYLIEKYQGTLEMKTRNHRFEIKMTIPINN